MSTELAEELGDPESLGRAALAAVMTEAGIGHWDKAVRLGRQAALMLEERCSGVAWEKRTNQDLLLQALNGLGAFREILDRVPGLLQDAEEHDDIYAQNQLGIWMARARLIQDRPERARDELEDVRARERGDLFRLPRLNAELIECEIGLYEGDIGVLDRLAELREEIIATNILKNQMLRVRLGILRARAALVQARSQTGVARQACLRLAESSVLAVEKEGTDWGSSLARVVEASIDVDRGRIDEAIDKYLSVEQSAHATRTQVLEQICSYRRGRLLGGDEGAELIRAAEDALRSVGVAAPERLCDLFAPDLSRR